MFTLEAQKTALRTRAKKILELAEDLPCVTHQYDDEPPVHRQHCGRCQLMLETEILIQALEKK